MTHSTWSQRLSAAVAMLSGLAVAPVGAELIAFGGTATVYLVDNLVGASVGDTVSFYLQFESTLPDQDPADSVEGYYASDTDGQVRIDATVATAGIRAVCQRAALFVTNNHPIYGDQVAVQGGDFFPGYDCSDPYAIYNSLVAIYLDNASGTALTTSAVVPQALPLASYPQQHVVILEYGVYGALEANITSLARVPVVPEPPGSALAALLALGVLARRGHAAPATSEMGSRRAASRN